MDAILLRSLPVKDPESLAMINWHMKGAPFGGGSKGVCFGCTGAASVVHAMSGSIYDSELGSTAAILPYPAFEVFQKRGSSVFSTAFAFRKTGQLNVLINGQASAAGGEYVSSDYFHGLGIPPAAGRLLIADDDRAGALPVAVISFGLAQARFGGAANASGASILIDNIPFTVVGVTPPEFFGVEPGDAPDVFIPLRANLAVGDAAFGGLAAAYLDRNYYWVEMMARLRPGISPRTGAGRVGWSIPSVGGEHGEDREGACGLAGAETR